MRRVAELHRGGHIWTAGPRRTPRRPTPTGISGQACSAPTGREGRPIVTLLVTSAKTGEGKSTTALNLAATCARAGERTLLARRRPEAFQPRRGLRGRERPGAGRRPSRRTSLAAGRGADRRPEPRFPADRATRPASRSRSWGRWRCGSCWKAFPGTTTV